VRVRPARLPAALLGLALALTGCAETAPAAEPDGGPATSSAPTASAQASSPQAQRIEVTVAGGQVTGDTGRVEVDAGEEVTLEITADVADEVHVHGYDLTAALTPGEPAALTFAATIPGVFEVELHHAGTVLLSLQVG
jgi:hypothetical protein